MKLMILIQKNRFAWNALLIVGLMFSFTSYTAFSSVQSIQYPSNINVCAGGGYTTLPNFTVYEQNANDFGSPSSVQTYSITLQDASIFNFKAGTGIVVFSKNTDISLQSINVTTTSVVLTLNVNTITNIDSITITGLQVNVINYNSAGSNISFDYVSGPSNSGLSDYFAHLNPQNSFTPTFSLGSLSSVCISAGNQSLTNSPVTVSPSGGTFSGTGVTGGNTFSPSTAGDGTFTLAYTATQNGCTGSATASITVFNSPTLDFSSIPSTELCSGNTGNVSLVGTGSPSGGTYSGTGVTGTNFSPSTAGIGSELITYTISGCSTTTAIKVNETPDVTFFGLANSYCSNAPDVNLTGFPTPGTFSGNGITGLVFQPSTLTPGSNASTVTYKYTDLNSGCQGVSLPQSVKIIQAPTNVTIKLTPFESNYLVTQDSVLISGNQNSPSGGVTFDTIVKGNGVSTNSAGISYFYPNTIGQGQSTITRTIVASNGCYASDSVKVTVSAPNAGIINGLNNVYCHTSAPSLLSVPNDQGTYYAYYYSASSGYVLDNNVFTNANVNNATVTFQPSKAVQGTSYIILFEGNVNFLEQVLEIQNPPVVTFTNIDSTYCNNTSSFPIKYSTSTGLKTANVTFSGTGVSNGDFVPSSIQANSTTTISYQYSDNNGCSSSGSVNTKVYEAPTNVGFTGINSTNCQSDPTVRIIVNASTPAGGIGTFAGSTLVDSNSLNQPIFNPRLTNLNGALSRNYYFIYTYTSPNGCSNVATWVDTVFAAPVVSLSGLQNNTTKAEFCVGATDITFTGTPLGGSTSVSALAPTLVNNSTFIPATNTFIPANANPGTYYINYKYQDPSTTCSNFTRDTIIINPLPVVSISNLKPKYCYQDSISILNPSPAFNSGLSYSITSSPVATSVAGSTFQPSLAGVGPETVTYTFTDLNGCTNSSSVSTVVYGKPVPDFRQSSYCENDSILFSDGGTQLISISLAPSTITEWVWQIDGDTIKNQTVTKALLRGNHTIVYTTITNEGCQDTEKKSIVIGSYPVTAFTYDKICNLDSTSFINASTIGVGTIDTLLWNFSDGSKTISFIGPFSPKSNGNIKHQFSLVQSSLPQTYNVTLKATSSYNCTTTDSQKIFILPAYTISSNTPYSNDFESNNGGWIASGASDTSSFSWALGVPSKSIINTTATQDHAWVTNLTGNYLPNEISYVYSPCFTFNDVPKPMIHLDYWSAVNFDESGANLQYTTNGTDWLTLDTLHASGVNWYNNATNINSRPSGPQSLYQVGWTGTDSSGWTNARHILDDAIGSNSNVRFRISFAGASSINVSDGFAFDNMWIGERSRLMLLEHFTNASNSSPVVPQENTYVNTLVDNAINDTTRNVVALEYHTSFGGPDPIYNRDIPDEGARSLYYGVSQVPQSSLDGSYYSGSGLLITQNMLDTRTLYDPEFGIILNTGYNVSTTTVNGTINLQSNIPVSNPVTLYISLAERKVVLTNPAETFEWVHSKFLPDAAGTSFAANWTVGQTQIVPFNWTFPSGYLFDPTQLMIIVFVQDNVTKEIYQTAYKALGSNAVVTSVFNPSLPTSTVSLFPNPANDLTSIVLNGTLGSNYSWNVVDELGRVVDQGTLQPNVDGFSIHTAAYASGFYTLRLSNSSDGVKAVKFVVVH